MGKLNGLTVFEYLNLNPEDRFKFFSQNMSNLPFAADYWFNFDKVKENVEELGADIFTLDYLVGKDENTIKEFFSTNPKMLKLIPKLLGIREHSMDKGVLSVDGFEEVYTLDFHNIEIHNLESYIDFINESGLLEMFETGISKSVKDYYVGVEAGLDSNGRKNRSGKVGEEFLERYLKQLSTRNNYQWSGQSTPKLIKEKYGIEIGDIFSNRRFDGSIFNPNENKLTLFEINLFNNNGSKPKAASTEFNVLNERILNAKHDFIYITDGSGWSSDDSYLKEAIRYIDHIFNIEMVKAGFIEDYLKG